MSPAAPEEGNTPSEAVTPLWYCEVCGHLISPAIAKTLRPDDKRLCPLCAGSSPGRSGKSQPRSGKTSPAVAEPLAAKASPAPAQPRPSSASLKPPPRDVPHRLPPIPAAVPTRSSTPLLLIAGGGAAIVILGLIALVLAWGSSQGTGPSKEHIKVATEPEPGQPAAPGEPERKEPAPVQPPAKPEPSAVTPTVPPGEAGKKDAPRPPEPPPAKPVASAAETLEAFQKDLAAAGEAVKGERFSAALELLRALKERAAGAPWWAEQQGAWAEADRQAREQLKEYTQEAESACAEAGKTDKVEALAQLEAAWKLRTAGSLPADAWVLLEPVSCRAERGTVLRQSADGSMLAGGPNPEKETYTVVAETRLPVMTAFRLDALADPSLPSGGPGRPQGNGNFVLTNVTVQAAPLGGGGSLKPVVLSRARADFSQDKFPVEATIDGDPNSGWGVVPQLGRPHTAVFELPAPLSEPGGARLTFTLACQSRFAGHNLGRFRLSATAARSPPAAAPEAPVVAPEAAPDALAFEPAQRVLRAVAAARSGMLIKARKKREAEIEAKVEALEQACKPRPRQIEANTRSLEEIEALSAQESESAAKYAERLGNLRFEIESVRQGELAVYRTATRVTGGAGEVQFDFSAAEQFGVWTFDNPGNCGSAQWDSRRHAAVLRTTGKHNWDGRERRDVPVLRLPFYFRADRWAIEAEVEHLSDANKPIKPEAGVLVWDGGGTVLQLMAREVPGKGYHVFLGGSTPKREQAWNRFVNVPGRAKEPVKLQMVCVMGVVSCNAATSSGSVYIGKETLGFDPGHAGVFVRTDEDNEDAQAAFRSVKLMGVPHSEKLKEVREKERPAALKGFAAALQRQAAVVRQMNEGTLVPLPLEKVATVASTKCLFQGRGEEDRLVLPRWGLLYVNGIPFVVGDPKGDTVSNAVLLQGPEGKPAAAAMPRSVTVPCGLPAGAIHLLSGISGGGWPAGEKGSRTLLVRLRYEDGKSEEHAFLNGVHFADFSRLVEVPGSTLAFRAREQQVRYLPVFPKRPQVAIKEIEFAKGEDKTAPLVLAVTVDKRLPLPKVYNPGLEGKTLADGKFGKALKLTGRGEDCVRVGHLDELDPPQLTFMAWLWLDEFPGGDARHWLVAKNENETRPGHVALLCEGDSVGAYLRAGREVHVKADQPKLRLKEWQHLAMTYDGAELKLFLNGAAIGSWSAGGPRETGTREFSIGMRPDGFQPFKALVDEVRVYNRAIPPEEMKLHLGDPGCTPRDGLAGYWSFDEAP